MIRLTTVNFIYLDCARVCSEVQVLLCMLLHILSVTYMKPFRQDNTTYFAWNRRFKRTMYWQQSMSHTWQNGSCNISHIDTFLWKRKNILVSDSQAQQIHVFKWFDT